MIPVKESSAMEFYEKGLGYLNDARKMSRSYKVVKPVLLYSILSMSIENLCMFMLMNRIQPPCHHSMRDLVEALESCGLMNEEIKNGMLHIEEVLTLCAMGIGEAKEPTMDEVFDFQCTAEKLLAVADAQSPAISA